jgi:colanic acid/amylovoran biosynthesis glycosyltransferase
LDYPRIAFVELWFPLPSETFVFHEVVCLWKLGVPVKVFSLYGERAKDLSPAMRAVSGQVERLGIPFLKEIHTHLAYWRRRHPALVRDLFRTIPFRRWSDLEMAGENLWAFLCGFRLARCFEEDGIGHIHASWGGGPATAAWVASRLTGIPFSFSIHATDIYPPDGALKEKVRDAVFVRSENRANVRHILQFVPGAEAKIHVVHNGFGLVPRAREDRGAKHPCRILGLGRFVPKKGFDILIRSCKLLDGSGLEFELVLGGSGACEGKLKRLVRELELEDRVRFPGFVTHDKVPEFMSSGDVFVMPSVIDATGDRDGLPTVILEALLHELPVVATDVCGIGEVIRDGETGFLVPQKDPFALAHAIAKVINNPDNSARTARQGRSLVQEEFDLDKISRALLHCFLETTPARNK